MRKDGIGSRLRDLASGLTGRRTRADTATRGAAFRLMYERFRELLVLNDSTLELIADIEDRLAGGAPFSFEAVAGSVRKAAMDVFVMVKNLNQIAKGKHEDLYETLRVLYARIERELGQGKDAGGGPLAISLSELGARDSGLVGFKMARLAEVGNRCGLPIPDGFVVTTSAVVRFMSQGDLWERCEDLEGTLEREGSAALAEACRKVRESILATAIPDEVERAIGEAYAACFPEPGVLVAVRSSAVGEDSETSSHAGVYTTLLDVDRDHLMRAYREVIASAFAPAAVSYRFERGLTARASLMAVGCIRMIPPRCAGIAFSRSPENPDSDAVLISATPGLAQRLAAGEEAAAEVLLVHPDREREVESDLLRPGDVASLVRVARRLEEHFGRPQDIEWAIDGAGGLSILQSRPLVSFRPDSGASEAPVRERIPLLAGGFAACPGVGAGPVTIVRTAADLTGFPEGGVLVARHSSPELAQAMTRAAAIVTDVGSPTGHMASLAREYGVPAIVGLEGASRTLEPGREITVDAGACRIYDGAIKERVTKRRGRPFPADSPVIEKLRRVSQLVTPLRLIDPASPDFTPQACRSLHDVTRFCHEKAFEEMFHYGDAASEDDRDALKLDARLPLLVHVFDVGGGLRSGAGEERSVRPEEIVCVPMRAFLEGLLEERIRWDQPRPVSARGFLSVLGETMTGPPAEALRIGRASYAIISDRYMNFSTKAGYHFSTVDTYCGRSQNKNYIHFRFTGGAAVHERRQRRIAFVSAILTALDFRVQTRSDLLTARLDKYASADILTRLIDLGRLTLCARQLDMLMDSDASPELFARAFLDGEWDRF